MKAKIKLMIILQTGSEKKTRLDVWKKIISEI